MPTLTRRQQEILRFVQQRSSVNNQEILAHLKDVSRITIVRDLGVLLAQKLIKQVGQGRTTRYQELLATPLLRYFDPEVYFLKGPDERAVAFERFNFGIFDGLHNLFNADDLRALKEKNALYQARIKKLSPAVLKKEMERLTIELSWKSSRIEGNTYSLLDTEALIKENREAPGHSKDEAIMILNHKRTLEYIMEHPAAFRIIILRHIRSIHDLMIKGLGVERGLRARPVGIVGTRYKPLDNEHQIKEALQKTLAALRHLKDPFSKTLAAIVVISYIQPFADGNKRTARMLGNAILLAHKVCPLSYRSVDEVAYKKATILWYEQNSIHTFKQLFIEQFHFAVDNYFLA